MEIFLNHVSKSYGELSRKIFFGADLREFLQYALPKEVLLKTTA